VASTSPFVIPVVEYDIIPVGDILSIQFTTALVLPVVPDLSKLKVKLQFSVNI
jgi:hypothetical protein